MNNYITYGYRLVDGDMRLDSGQSEAVQLIFDAYDGGESIKKIAGMLKDKKVPSVRGKPSWTPSLIRKILSNKDYLGVEPYPRMIEEEQFERVQKCLKRSRDLWNQRHPSGSIQGTSMYTDRLICSRCGRVYSIYKQSVRGDKRDVRYWKCRHYDPATKEPCKMPILTEKQLDGMFLQALMRMKTEPTLYQEETKKILTGIIKEKQRMESELNVCWNRCNKDDKRMEQLYFQIAARRYQEIKLADLTHQIEEYLREMNASTQADSIDSLKTIDTSVFKIIKRVEVQPDRSLRFELINRAVVLQYPEIKTKDKKSKNIRYCVPFGYWLDTQEVPIIHEQYGPIVQRIFQSYAKGMSLTALANELESQSIPNQKGKPAWSHSCIRNILTNPVYLGDKKFPALVTQELFTQVQTRLEETGRMKRESRSRISPGKEGTYAKGGTNRRGHPGHLEPGR
ncbi:recombinase family protein [Enterocloster sp.]|uniref:recombinase family protein n=1 Tax=Enterocloster sp. TaxID=2719315 RepID=UPI00257B419B|nr:recombinase family protein [Enterocloster sp.]MBS5406698.1 recombinase family protein [Enterocloster sp.]